MKFHFIPILVNEFGHFSAKIWWNFVRISRIFSENDEMSRVSHKKCPKNAEKGRKFRNWCQISFVHFICSIVSLAATPHHALEVDALAARDPGRDRFAGMQWFCQIDSYDSVNSSFDGGFFFRRLVQSLCVFEFLKTLDWLQIFVLMGLTTI